MKSLLLSPCFCLASKNSAHLTAWLDALCTILPIESSNSCGLMLIHWVFDSLASSVRCNAGTHNSLMLVTACWCVCCTSVIQASTDLRHVLNAAAGITISHLSGFTAAGGRGDATAICCAGVHACPARAGMLLLTPPLLCVATDGRRGVGIVDDACSPLNTLRHVRWQSKGVVGLLVFIETLAHLGGTR